VKGGHYVLRVHGTDSSQRRSEKNGGQGGSDGVLSSWIAMQTRENAEGKGGCLTVLTPSQSPYRRTLSGSKTHGGRVQRVGSQLSPYHFLETAGHHGKQKATKEAELISRGEAAFSPKNRQSINPGGGMV